MKRAGGQPSVGFSTRAAFGSEENRLSRAVARRRERGEALLDLTVSNPTAAGFPAPEGILDALGAPGNLAYAPDPRGLLEARRQLSSFLAARGLAVAPERLVLTASTSEAYAYLFKLLADPGDAVLVPAPSYPLFDYLAGLESLAVRRWRLTWDGRWHVDRDSVLQGLAGAKAIVVIHPNNPTGSYLSRDDLAFLASTCRAHGLALIGDEVFLDYALEADPARAASVLGRNECLTFALGGLSKMAGLPQLKLGWIALGGPEALVDTALARLELIADSYLSVSSPVQHALPSILAGVAAFQRQVLARLQRNLSAAREAFAAPMPVSALRVEGGWTLPLRFPAIRSGEDWAVELVERDGVLVQPGYFYDFEGEAWVVVSLLTPESDFDRGLEVLREACRRPG